MSNAEKDRQSNGQENGDDDDEPDEWDKRIFSTGCAGKIEPSGLYGILKAVAISNNEAEENTKLNDCFYEKRDWRACKDEMEAFKQCWKRRGNEQRTESKDA